MTVPAFALSGYQTALVIFVLFCLTGELLLLILKISHSAPLVPCVRSACFAGSNIVMLILLTGDKAYRIHGIAPWVLVVLLAAASAVHLILAFPKEQKRAKGCLSPASIHEAINNLPMGLCFGTPNGRIILCNHKMRKVANRLIGGYPQMMEDMTAALQNPPENVSRLPEGSLWLPSGRIYQFRLFELTVGEQAGWSQLLAQDITELYGINEQLNKQNEKLKKTNAKLQKMYDRMADDIRERESLELKVHIHDTIGRSLITIKDIMQSDEETEKKLKSLREAVGVLSNNRAAFQDTMDEVRQNAAKMGVTVKVQGYIPAGTVVENLTVMAARECATNCLRHAKGSEILVDIQELGGIYKVVITNNGEKPKGKITEGSGLSSLRRSVEAWGGEMYVSHEPAFALILNLPEKEAEDD